MKELLRIPEAARRLNVAPKTIRTWVAQRKIAHVRLGRNIRIEVSEIERIIEAGYMPAKHEDKHR